MEEFAFNKVNIVRAAIVAHEVNRAYNKSLGDESIQTWSEAPGEQRQSIIAGIRLHWTGLRVGSPVTPEHSHAAWLLRKTDEGWTFGPVKDLANKKHPCCVPYDELPAEQKTKDFLFGAVARSMYEIFEAV